MNNKNKEIIAMASGEDENSFLPMAGEESTFADAEAQKSLEEMEEQYRPQEKQQMPMLKGDKFRHEIAALLKLHPELRDKFTKGEELPREVIAACAKTGIPLRAAFAEYEAKQARAEIERLRKENEILKQNASAAAKGPVKGTASGGTTDTKGKDPFLEGLLSDD